MNLSAFVTICSRLDNYCIYARERAPREEAGPELLGRAAALEAALLEEHETKGENLALSCMELAGNPARAGLIERYKQNFAVSGQIRALEADLTAGAVSCPESVRGPLILALLGLRSLCEELARVCVSEFDKMEPKGGQDSKSMPELIEGCDKALRLAGALQKAGYLDSAYLFRYERGKTTRIEEGRAAQALADKFDKRGMLARIEKYWGMKEGRLKSYAGAKGRTEKIDSIINNNQQ